MARCLVCEPSADIPDPELLDHLRLLHPEQYGDGPECWPDGSLVIAPEDFGPEDITKGGGDD